MLQQDRPFPYVLRVRFVPLRDIIFICAVLLFCAAFLASVPLRSSETFSLGSVDHLTAQGFYPAETDELGRGLRWTDGDSEVYLPPQGLGAHNLRLTISAPRPIVAGVPLTITINGWPALAVKQPGQSRRYDLLVPADQVRLADNVVRIESTTFRPQQRSDGRTLGVVVFDVGWWRMSEQGWLAPIQILSVAITTTIFYLLLVTASIRFWWRLPVVVLFVAITIAMRHSDTRFIYRWHAIAMSLALGLVFLVALIVLRWRRADDSILSFRDWVARHWMAFAGYIGVTLLMLYPLVARFTTNILGVAGDSYENLWKLQWFNDALIQQHVSPAFAPQVLYPSGFDLAHAESAGQALLGLPVTWLFGPVASYNTAALVSYILTGFFTYLLAHRIGATRGAAWVAGLLFAFCLPRYYHLLGHLGLTGTQWLPLALYGWEGVLTRRRTWDGYVSGIGFGLTAWSSWYYTPTFALLLACYTPLRLGLRGLPGFVHSWRAVVLMGAISLALILPLAQPYLEARQRGETFKQELVQLRVHSARPIDFLSPNPFHPLWGSWARQFFRDDGSEHFVALGYSLIVLALAGIWLGRKHKGVVRALVVIIVINMIMSLGPVLHVAKSDIPLPALFVYNHIPILNGIRVWNRMVLYVVMCAAVLASLALSAIPRRWYRVGWIGAAALVLLEYAAVSPTQAPHPRAVDLWLKQQPSTGAVIQIPNGFSGASLYYLSLSAKPNNLGYWTFAPTIYLDECKTLLTETCNALRKFPDTPAVRLMQRWQTEYVVVDEQAMKRLEPRWDAKIAAQSLITLEYRSNGYSVYRLKRYGVTS